MAKTANDVLEEFRDGHKQGVRDKMIAWARAHASSAPIGEVFAIIAEMEHAVDSIADHAFRIGTDRAIYDKAA